MPNTNAGYCPICLAGTQDEQFSYPHQCPPSTGPRFEARMLCHRMYLRGEVKSPEDYADLMAMLSEGGLAGDSVSMAGLDDLLDGLRKHDGNVLLDKIFPSEDAP